MSGYRNVRITIRLSSSERERIHARAKAQHISASDLVRASVLGPGSASALPSRDLLAKAVRQASGAASNVNQIARRINELAKDGKLDESAVRMALPVLKDLHRQIIGGLDDVVAETVRLRPK